jgi:hypothetical protein
MDDLTTIDPNEPLICEDVRIGELKQLAIMAITQALRDATSGSVERRLDAVLWLTGEDSGFWLEWAGLPYVDPIAIVTRGRFPQMIMRKRK